MKNTAQKDYNQLVKLLQILSAAVMLAALIACVVLMRKYDISVRNLSALQELISGSVFAVAVGLILFSVVKSFALVFPPAVLFALSGLVFENYFLAIGINVIATALSLSLPYFLGRFTGSGMLESLRGRFPKVQKIDDFAQSNDFILVLIIKMSGALPSDLSSLIFGALNIPYGKYMVAANIGMLPLNILWTLLGNKGDLSNPLSFLYVLPIVFIAVGGALVFKRFEKKAKARAQQDLV